MATLSLKLRIWRQAGPGQPGRLVDYQTTANEDMSFLEMLDVVNDGLIRQGQDPVAFDSDCREGICGSCGLVVNGVPHGPDPGGTVCQLHMRRFKNGETIKASLAIAADGRESPMRELMGLKIISWSYAQWGIVATVAHEKPHNGVAYEHFLPAGPFAILPMTSAPGDDGRKRINRSSLVWTEKDTLAPGMMKLDGDAFDAEIARRFGGHLGTTKAAGPRWSGRSSRSGRRPPSRPPSHGAPRGRARRSHVHRIRPTRHTLRRRCRCLADRRAGAEGP